MHVQLLHINAGNLKTIVMGCYLLDRIMKTYKFFINPTNSQEFWEKTPYVKPIPPKIKRSAGRPKKNRRKDGNECDVVGGKLKRSYNAWTCSICKQEGHNSRDVLISHLYQYKKSKTNKGKQELKELKHKLKFHCLSLDH